MQLYSGRQVEFREGQCRLPDSHRSLSSLPWPRLSPPLSPSSGQRENLAQSMLFAKNRPIFIEMKEEGGSSRKRQLLKKVRVTNAVSLSTEALDITELFHGVSLQAVSRGRVLGRGCRLRPGPAPRVSPGRTLRIHGFDFHFPAPRKTSAINM